MRYYNAMQKVIPLLIIPFFLFTSEIVYSPGYDQCLDKSGGITVNIRECNARELKYQDALLNRYYRQAMNRLSGKQRQELRDAQRAWIRYRDANCQLYYGLTGGTIDILNGSSCYVDMTARRARELYQLIQML